MSARTSALLARHGHPPGGESTRFGVVIRPPAYRLDDDGLVCDELVGVDCAGLDADVEVVVEGNFVGLVAATPERARAAADALRLAWRSREEAGRAPAAVPDTQERLPALGEEGGGAFERRYGWPGRMRWGDAEGWAVAELGAGWLQAWGATASPEVLTRDLAILSGLAPEAIALHGPVATSRLGRHCGDDAIVDAALLSRAVGGPVAIWLDAGYARDRAAFGLSQRIAIDARLAADGEVAEYRSHQALSGEAPAAMALWLSGAVAARRRAADARGGDAHADSPDAFPRFFPYAFGRQRFAAPGERVAEAWEAPIETQNAFARESFIDELARASGQDAVALRLRHLRDERGRELIETVARRAGWRTPLPEAAAMELARGRGFAFAQYPDRRGGPDAGVRSAWVADIEVNRITGEVRLSRLVVGQDSGPTVDTARLRSTLQQRVLGAARPLLGRTPAFDEWGDGGEPNAAETRVPATAPGTSPAHRDATEARDLDSRSTDAGEEVDLSPGVAVIANALFDATGVRFREPPFTADRVRRALEEERGGREERGAAEAGAAPRRWRWMGAALAAAGAVAVLWPWKTPIAPAARPAANLYSAETIERGRLVAAAGDCAACHTADGGTANAGGRPFETPFGTLYSTNITPDEATGIGQWSYAAFERAMRHGIGRDGRHLYPAFPYTAFARTSDADMQALYAYLMAQPAVAAPPPVNELAFPFSRRELLAGWKALFHDARPFEPDPARSELYNRGAYLAEGLGHCGACHTPRNRLGAEKGGEHYLAGALVDGWEAPPLNALSRSPVPWSEASLYDYLHHGRSELHGVASGPMAPVVAGLAELPEYDVRAIAHYVAAQMGAPAADSDAALETARRLVVRAEAAPSGMEAGERLFEGACASCHVESGVPSFTAASTPLALNTNLHGDRPDNVIQSILGGVHATAVPGIGEMPGFAGSFSDSQVTTLVAYLRARFAPDRPAWADLPARVAGIRHENDKTQ